MDVSGDSTFQVGCPPVKLTRVRQGRIGAAELCEGFMATVLIVDDHRSTALAMQKLLRLWGHQGVSAENATEALRILFSKPPDVVVLDVMMPGISGLDVLRALHGDATLRTLPVMMFTAVDDPATRAEAMRLGAREFFIKGQIDWAVLQQAIQRHATAERSDPAALQ